MILVSWATPTTHSRPYYTVLYDTQNNNIVIVLLEYIVMTALLEYFDLLQNSSGLICSGPAYYDFLSPIQLCSL